MLPCRRSPGLSGALPFEDAEPRLCMRLVCICPTEIGLVVWERRAAAAAALERLALEFRLARKACVAAVEAAALGTLLTSRGYALDVSYRSKFIGWYALRGLTGFELALLRPNMTLQDILSLPYRRLDQLSRFPMSLKLLDDYRRWVLWWCIYAQFPEWLPGWFCGSLEMRAMEPRIMLLVGSWTPEKSRARLFTCE